MEPNRNRWRSVSLAAAVLAALVLLAVATAQGGAPAGWTRMEEPVILTGSLLGAFGGAPLDELFAYSYSGGTWTQIPFQIDEVDASNVYTTENGLLDGNDELVFMAMDLGQKAGPADWIEDADAQAHARYQLLVSNPLDPAEQGWVYVYRSATLAPQFGDYVRWDDVNKRTIAGTYIAGTAPEVMVGLDSLYLNGSQVDALDRSKIRLSAVCYVFGIPIPYTFTEEDLADLLGVTTGIDGPVRVGGGSTQNYIWSYYALYKVRTSANLDSFEVPGCQSVVIEEVRESFDWRDPVASGMAPAKYYDQNVDTGVAIDGQLDSVPPLPFSGYQEVSGGQGTMVQTLDLSLGGGTQKNYYRDDQTVDPVDTGDQKSFGDAGFLIESPSGQLTFAQSTYLLAPDLPNVGETYLEYQSDPLLVAAQAQTVPPSTVWRVYMPFVVRGPGG